MGCCSSAEDKPKNLILQRILSHDNTIEVIVHPDHVDVFDKTATDCCGTREIAEISLDVGEDQLIVPSAILYPDSSSMPNENNNNKMFNNSRKELFPSSSAKPEQTNSLNPARSSTTTTNTLQAQPSPTTSNPKEPATSPSSQQVTMAERNLRDINRGNNKTDFNDADHDGYQCVGEALQAQSTAVSHDGNTFAVSDNKGRVSIFDMNSGIRRCEPVVTGSDGKIIDAIAFSKHDRYLYCCCSWNDRVNRPIYVIDVKLGKQIHSFAHKHKSSVYRLVLSPTFFNVSGDKQQLLATLANDYTIGIWRLKNKDVCDLDLALDEDENENEDEEQKDKKIRPNAASRTALVLGEKHECAGCTFTHPELLTMMGGEAGCATDIAFVDANVLLSLSHNKELRYWNIGKGKETRAPLATGHTYTAHCLAVSPDGKTIATGSQDKQLRLFDLDSWKEIITPKQFKGHHGSITSIYFVPVETSPPLLISAGAGGTVRIWNASTGECIHSIEMGRILVSAVLSPNCESLAVTMEFPPRVKLFAFSVGRILAKCSYNSDGKAILAKDMFVSHVELLDEAGLRVQDVTMKKNNPKAFNFEVSMKQIRDEMEDEGKIALIRKKAEAGASLAAMAAAMKANRLAAENAGATPQSNNNNNALMLKQESMEVAIPAPKRNFSFGKQKRQPAATTTTTTGTAGNNNLFANWDFNEGDNNTNNNNNDRKNQNNNNNNNLGNSVSPTSFDNTNPGSKTPSRSGDTNVGYPARRRRMSVFGGDAAAAASAAAAKKRYEEEEAALQEVMRKKQEDLAKQEAKAKNNIFGINGSNAGNDNDNDDSVSNSNSTKQRNEEQKRKIQAHMSKHQTPEVLFMPEGTTGPPSASCFVKFRHQTLNFEEVIRSALSMSGQTPENRQQEFARFVHATDDEVNATMKKVLTAVNEVAMPEFTKSKEMLELVEQCKLTQDDLRIIHIFNYTSDEEDAQYDLKQSLSAASSSSSMLFPFAKWVNGWLQGTKRDSLFRNHVGPIFSMYQRALEKLPKISSQGARSFIVKTNPQVFRHTFAHHKQRLSVGRVICFWSLATFTTDQSAVVSEEFLGDFEDDACIYSCGEIAGVDVSLFTLRNSNAFRQKVGEILPLCPSVFEVAKMEDLETKLSITLNQIVTDLFDYTRQNYNITAATNNNASGKFLPAQDGTSAHRHHHHHSNSNIEN